MDLVTEMLFYIYKPEKKDLGTFSFEEKSRVS